MFPKSDYLSVGFKTDLLVIEYAGYTINTKKEIPTSEYKSYDCFLLYLIIYISPD